METLRNLSKLIGVSLVALMFCSIATSGVSAAVYSYSLVVEKGAYAKYQCVFGNDTASLFTTGSTFAYLAADINMTRGYTIVDLIDTHYIEGALFVIYVNDTIFDFENTNDLPYPLRFLLTPASNEWWTFFETWVEAQSVNNNVVIGTDTVDVTWFTSNSGNETFTGTLDRDTGVVLNFKEVVIDLGTNSTYVSDLRLIETNVPNLPGSTVPQPISTLLIAGIIGGGAIVGLGAGFFLGRKRAA